MLHDPVILPEGKIVILSDITLHAHPLKLLIEFIK